MTRSLAGVFECEAGDPLCRGSLKITGRNALSLLGIILVAVSAAFGIRGLAYFTTYDLRSDTIWLLLGPIHIIIFVLLIFRYKIHVFDQHDWFRVVAFTYAVGAGVGAIGTGLRYLDSLFWSRTPFFQLIVFEKDDLPLQIVLWALFTMPYWIFVRLDINNRTRGK